MGTQGKPTRAWLSNTILVIASVLVSLVVAEAAVRLIDARPLLAFPLPEPIGAATTPARDLDHVALAQGVERAWYTEDPPPVPRQPAPADWQSLFWQLEARPDRQFRTSDAFKAWNRVFAAAPCTNDYLRQAPGWLYVYDPADRHERPTYRFPPDVTTPLGLTTNQIGWRGRQIAAPRAEQTIRIVFVGSSTVVDYHHVPFSYPEFVGGWLNRWAEARKLDVRFEVLNAGREAITSTDIAAIVKTEVLPLRPDLVVYYEGGNQLDPYTMVPPMKRGAPPPPDGGPPRSPNWLQAAAQFSALAARAQSAVIGWRNTLDGREYPRPAYRMNWPQGLDRQDPDLAFPQLPIHLNDIVRDLNSIRRDLGTIGSEFVLSSFMWMVRDGMVLDPVRQRAMLDDINARVFPLSYADFERLAAFQNRVFAKYAQLHGVPFIDVAGLMPYDPALFTDGSHTNYAGTRLRAWVTFNQLLPLIEKHLGDRSWPRRLSEPEPPLPTFTMRRITVDCRG